MMYWDDALRTLRTARWPQTSGKKIQNNTHLFLDGTFDEPQQIRLKYHNTNIIILKPNGDRYICTDWSSMSTLERLREHANVSVFCADIPAINGYKTNPERGHFIKVYGSDMTVPFQGNASVPDGGRYNNYIRVMPGGEVDLATVNPIEVKCVIDDQKLRKIMRHVGKISRLALGYIKLRGDWPIAEPENQVNMYTWLMQRYKTPLEEIQLSPFPFFGDNPKNDFKAGMDAIRWDIAVREECVGVACLLKTL